MGMFEFFHGKPPKLEEQLIEIKSGIFNCWIGGSDDVIDGAFSYLYSNPDMKNPFNWDQVKLTLDEQGVCTSQQLVWHSLGISRTFRGPNPLSLFAAAVGTENKPLDIPWKNIQSFRLQQVTMMRQKKAESYCILLFQNQLKNRKEWLAFRFYHEEVFRIFVRQLEEHDIHLEDVSEQNHSAKDSDSSQDVEKALSLSGRDFGSFPLERKIADIEEKTVVMIMEKLKQKETEELVEIWNKHNSEEWTPEAFEAIRRILIERRNQEEKP